MIACGPGIRIHPESSVDQVNQRIWTDDPNADMEKACDTCASTMMASHGMHGEWKCTKFRGQMHLQGCAYLQRCRLSPAPNPSIPKPPLGNCRSKCASLAECGGEDPTMISAFCDQYNSKDQCDATGNQIQRTRGETYCKWMPPGDGVAPKPLSQILNGKPCAQLKRTTC